MLLRFSKMHGLGNDFMVVDLLSQRLKLSTELIQSLANRHTGVGFDQLLIVEPPKSSQADFFYRIFNANGQEVEQCGNGARCVARFVVNHGFTAKRQIVMQTMNASLTMHVMDHDQVQVTFNPPKFSPIDIPLNMSEQQASYHLIIEQESLKVQALSVGNPHAVLFVDDADTADVARFGPLIESHSLFPEKVNAGFMQVMQRNEIKLRVFERHVGETNACGSGACAAVVAGIKSGVLDHEVRVHLRGGDLLVKWDGQDNSEIIQTGPAVWVFEGKIRL